MGNRNRIRMRRLYCCTRVLTPLLAGLLWLLTLAPLTAQFENAEADPNVLPRVPPGFEVSVFAREPLVRQPCSMAFDAAGRLFVGMGPQYRHPQPDTPGDSVVMVLDTDGDGVADATKVFARGFNAVQGLAWRGSDLWVANAPDLTVVRDLDGDDEADEYVRVYTDLGNLEHGLHGLNWAPDGKLYMSKGNSKGLTQPGRIAPQPFRELWGVTAPPGVEDFPEPQTFSKHQYRRAYHDPADDWGREGGILRCDDDGKNLEIVARGLRNPWDIAADSGFHWLGTDNDQIGGDRVVMPFLGAPFGWNHAWSSHWSTEPHPPTAPVSGPLFEGSGTGLVFYDGPQPPSWIAANFQRSEQQIQADHWTYQLYHRDFAAGSVQLGGNTDDGQSGGKSHYIVVLEPRSLPRPERPTTIDEVLAKLATADAARGEILFRHAGGAGCVHLGGGQMPNTSSRRCSIPVPSSPKAFSNS